MGTVYAKVDHLLSFVFVIKETRKLTYSKIMETIINFISRKAHKNT